MPNDYFHLVPNIISHGLVYPVARDQVESLLDQDGVIDDTFEVALEDELGVPQLLVLRFRIGCKHPYPESWRMSLLLHNKRFACIDHHVRYKDKHGAHQKGWHYHEWSTEEYSCENLRIALEGFNPVTVRDFLESGLPILGVQLKEGGDD